MAHKGSSLTLILSMILACFASDARAAGVEGAGARSCAYFLQNYKTTPNGAEDFYFSWAQGYMSGLNVAKLNDERGAFQAMSMELQKDHIRNFCQENPTKEYFYAVIDLYTTIYPKQTTPLH